MSGSGGGDIDMLSCANCGIGEENSNKLKKCSACLLVKYCSAECQKAHRPQHKKACKIRAAELHDEQLFKEPPPPDDCPICLIPLPLNESQIQFQSCCGKLICDGCVYTMQIREGKFLRCPFCRVPNATSNDEHIKWTKELMDKGDAEAFSFLAFSYESGRYGLPQDCAKAHELYLKAGELGCAEAYYNLGQVFSQGRGVEVDKTKAKHYYELAAIGGDMHARHNIGCTEGRDGNLPRAMKHFMIGARAGNDRSLDNVKTGFMRGIVTKDEYASTLRAHQLRKDEMKSDSREKAEAYYRHLS